MNTQNNKSVTGAGVGGALGYLVVWIGPQFGLFTVSTPEEGAMVATAFGMLFSWGARYLPDVN